VAYDIATEQIHAVDLEGGDALLKGGQLDVPEPSFVVCFPSPSLALLLLLPDEARVR
jgi:hypothetical protein